MPEGHTLHRLAGALEAAFPGTAPAASSPQGRFVEGAALLDRRPLLGAQAWGKHLVVDYAGDVHLHVHLGLIGSFDVTRQPSSPAGYAAVPPPVGAVRLRLVTDGSDRVGSDAPAAWARVWDALGERAAYLADLRGATHVAVATPEEVEAVIARLGPDPLRPVGDGDGHNDPERAWARIARSPRSIADLLMDQAVLAGVGNVYRCEVLFRHRIDPHRPGREIRRATWETIWADLVILLRIGVDLGQIVTMADQVELALAAAYDPALVPVTPTGVSAWRPKPLPGAMQRRYYVYKRQGEPCLVCGSRVRMAQVAGRRLYWCGRCQRRR